MVLLSVKSIQGKREYMEDRYAYIEEDGITIAMVCDGHGGYQAAHRTSKELPYILLSALRRSHGSNVKHAETIRNVLLDWGASVDDHRSGSTLTGVAVINNTVFIYNIGDSRTCMQLIPGTFVYFLKPMFDYHGSYMDHLHVDYAQSQFFCTTDHDPDSMDEVKRVTDRGGRITGKRLNGILSVTRALGDTDVGKGLSYTPDVFWVKKSSVAGPIAMYSDGIYEMQRYKTEANFNDRYLYYIGNRFGADTLVDYAYENGSDDNLTAMLITV